MSSKKIYLIVAIIFIILVLSVIVFYITNKDDMTYIPPVNNEEEGRKELNIPTKGNDNYLDTTSNTSIRVINEYDESFFTADKNLLIMFASWCPNCQKEITEIEKILEYYKDNNEVSIVLIAHEYDNTIVNLIDLIENDVNFGDAEIKIDLKRIIRKTIDPEASTIPISYVVDKKGNVLEVYNNSLTLQKAKEMLK